MSSRSSVEKSDFEDEGRKRHIDIDLESLTSSTPTVIASHYLEREEQAGGLSSSLPLSVFLVMSWLLISSATILFNKYIIDAMAFPFPITLTCWHLVVASIVTQFLAHTTNFLDNRKKMNMTGRRYLRAILPIGLLYSGSLVCSNLPYLTLSVAFIQMLKGLGPAAVLLATCSLGLGLASWKRWMNVFVIVLGVVAASFGEIKFVLSGFLYQIGGLFFEAYRLGLIQKLLSADDQKMDPLVSLYYYAPTCAAMLAAVALIAELPRISLPEVLHVGLWTLAGNAAVAFLLNVASVMLIGKTSSLVLTLCGVLKNILLVVASVLIWGTVVTRLQIAGYGVTSIGLLYYSLGAETIHRFFRWQEAVKEGQTEKVPGRRRFGKRRIAMILIGFAAAAGALGGAVAGYSVEWDPRLYWYSANRFSDR